MAIYAELEIEDCQYSLLECEYEFTQAVDITGRPSDRPRGGLIHLTIPSPADDDLRFHEWMREKDLVKKGKITIKVNSLGGFAEKTLFFKDAYCIGLREYFNKNDEMPMSTKISIMAGELSFGDRNNGIVFKMID